MGDHSLWYVLIRLRKREDQHGVGFGTSGGLIPVPVHQVSSTPVHVPVQHAGTSTGIEY